MFIDKTKFRTCWLCQENKPWALFPPQHREHTSWWWNWSSRTDNDPHESDAMCAPCQLRWKQFTRQTRRAMQRHIQDKPRTIRTPNNHLHDERDRTCWKCAHCQQPKSLGEIGHILPGGTKYPQRKKDNNNETQIAGVGMQALVCEYCYNSQGETPVRDFLVKRMPMMAGQCDTCGLWKYDEYFHASPGEESDGRLHANCAKCEENNKNTNSNTAAADSSKKSNNDAAPRKGGSKSGQGPKKTHLNTLNDFDLEEEYMNAVDPYGDDYGDFYSQDDIEYPRDDEKYSNYHDDDESSQDEEGDDSHDDRPNEKSQQSAKPPEECSICLEPNRPLVKLMKRCQHARACRPCLQKHYFPLSAARYPYTCFYPGCDKILRDVQMERIGASEEELGRYYKIEYSYHEEKQKQLQRKGPSKNLPKRKPEGIIKLMQDAVVLLNGSGRAVPCPHCRILIVKEGGCDRMECSACQQLFSWKQASDEWRDLVHQEISRINATEDPFSKKSKKVANFVRETHLQRRLDKFGLAHDYKDDEE